MISKNKKRYTYSGLGMFLFVCLLLGGSSIARRATAAPRISEEEAIAVAAGGEIGPNDFRISDARADLDSEAADPAVVYNAADNEYLVVWEGEYNVLGHVEREIEGQILQADGTEIGEDDFRISNTVPDGEYYHDSVDVAYNATENQYLVVWSGTEVLADSSTERDVYGQLIDTGGAAAGSNFRISTAGNWVDSPAVAYNPNLNQYLVVWEGSDNWIYGQLLDATGMKIADNDLPIGNMYEVDRPDVAHNSVTNQYLVVWQGINDAIALSEHEIYGQLLQADGVETGMNDFRISDIGPDGNTSYIAEPPSVAYDATANQYLVVWNGHDNQGDLDISEKEIFGQALLADGTETDENGFRLSDMGPDGDSRFWAENAAVSCSTLAGQCLVVWSGDDDTVPLVDDENEIFGQLYDSGTVEPPPPPPTPSVHQLFLPLVKG